MPLDHKTLALPALRRGFDASKTYNARVLPIPEHGAFPFSAHRCRCTVQGPLHHVWPLRAGPLGPLVVLQLRSTQALLQALRRRSRSSSGNLGCPTPSASLRARCRARFVAGPMHITCAISPVSSLKKTHIHAIEFDVHSNVPRHLRARHDIGSRLGAGK